MVQVADWSGWVDDSYSPPRYIPLWELWNEEEKQFGTFPAKWRFVGTGEEDTIILPDSLFCDYCGRMLEADNRCPNCGYAGLG